MKLFRSLQANLSRALVFTCILLSVWGKQMSGTYKHHMMPLHDHSTFENIQ